MTAFMGELDMERDNKRTNEESNTNVRHLLFASSILATVVVEASIVCAQPGIGTGAERLVDWPATPAGRCSNAFFHALNTDGEDALRQFVKEHYSDKVPLEEELASHIQLRKIAGKLEAHSATTDGDFAIDIFARSPIFGWVKFRIELSKDSPHYVTKMEARPGSPPKAEGPKDYRDWKDLRDLVEQVRSDSGAPGMVAAIVRGGKIIEKTATGVRRFDRPDKIRIGDMFHIGSVSKTFTGTMIGKLLEDGALRWNMTIGEVLSDLSMREEYRGITLEQLLQHRGGVPSLPTMGEFADGFPAASGCTAAEARAALVRQVLTEDPVDSGEYSYSNAGYVVAAYMVERTVKRSWEELMRTLVLEPLGLRSTGFGWPATEKRPDQPRGHYGEPPELKVQIGEFILFDMDYVGPAGNMHCSIEDLARFAAYHLRVLNDGDTSLKAETVPRFWRGAETDDGERKYGFFGSGGTFMAMIMLYPDSDLAVVAAANIGLPAMPFFEKMENAVHERWAHSKEGKRESD